MVISIIFVIILITVTAYLVNLKVASFRRKSSKAKSNSTVESKTHLFPKDLESVSLSQGENSNNTNMVLVYTDGEKRYMDRSLLESLIRGTVSFEWVDRDSISDLLIKDIMEKKRSFMGAVVEPKAVTRSTVCSHVNRSISMAVPPVKGIELDDFFLFSGGTRDRVVDDFSTGYVVEKKTGEIFEW